MDSTIEIATEGIEAVRFGFYKDEEVKKMSFKKIMSPELLDGLGRPTIGGLYDPTLGPLDDRSICKTCGQVSSQCPGHCGHIELVSVIYNPLLFDMLYNLLQRTCFICHHFRAAPAQVARCASRLEHIIDGDIVEAEKLNSRAKDGPYTMHRGQKTREWTSFQYSAAMFELNNFLKQRHKDCRNCKARNPTISKPTFGWFAMSTASDDIRSNIIRDCKMQGEIAYGSGVNSFTNHEDKKLPPDEYFKQKAYFKGQLLPSDVMFILENLWEKEPRLCSFIGDIQAGKMHNYVRKESCAMFFLKTVLVPPIKFRLPARRGDTMMVHPHTVLLGKVVEANISLGNAHLNKLKNILIVRRWMDLQFAVNVLFDSKTATGQAQKDGGSGICQLLEKKEGIFRQKMMGKRVNFACRSVISPDPYLSVNEIGIPPYFALRLTYPERVTPWNAIGLRDCIVNGPEAYPGATHYVDKVATRKLPLCRRTRVSISRKLPSSRGIAADPGKSCDNAFEGKVVYRHLRDGDIVLVNRQPTLHKPSIMAHTVRVLQGEQTLRMHYANCSIYNADFDGDEMNVHFPQDEISRAEAYNIVNANNQYIIPTRGDAGRGLIQDHIVSAVLLTKKDTFLTREEFNQLLYSSGVSSVGPVHFSGRPSKKVKVLDFDTEMEPIQPAIWKPKPLWTGKQVITAVLNHITRGLEPFIVEKDGKIPREYFGIRGKAAQKKIHPGEHTLFVYKNELVHGVIDKAQFGNYGLVHTVQELYGSNVAGNLLSVFSRLFTVFLQIHGFTCGVDDLLIQPDYDVKRKIELERAENLGEDVHSQFIGLKDDNLDSTNLHFEVEKAIRNNGESATACLDRMMSSELNDKTSDINKDLLHRGLVKHFPKNCISLMTTTGAKGSMVNFSQISSFLGQQELEGKRVPRMISGKTLPCFPPWDYSPRAGGFISDRFLTGLRPQEYYFHCMAGREGLVDTAVKTSRSGYLQRCLIKNLECLKIGYDYTVRDADGAIVQFCYGEDGVDVHQSSFLVEFKALADNRDVLREKFGLKPDNTRHLEISSDIEKLPFVKNLLEKRENLHNKLFSKEVLRKSSRDKQEDLMDLINHKYFTSLAQPGEPVGVLAAQSVGEPTTQMTLNTFHLAGRGEMNVTLGIPRLQEVLMTASDDIRTPIMECPLQKGKTKDDGKRLAGMLRKITLADIVESVEVCVAPVSQQNNKACCIYKLKIKLYDPDLFPPYSGISLEGCTEILEVVYMRELEDAIQSHILLISRISGIRNFVPSERKGGDEGDRHESDGKEDVDDDVNDEEADDIGLDMEKRKQQVTDEVDYEDASDTEVKGDDGGEGEVIDQDDENEVKMVEPEERGEAEERGGVEAVTTGGKSKNSRTGKGSDRCVYAATDGLYFEAHFKFVDEPHILLGQVAQRVAKKVYLKNQGKISRCEVVERSSRQLLGWEDGGERRAKRWVLQAGGVDFKSFWKMQDDLDIRCLYSNDVHAMLRTYGVEAARSTIIREVQNVFGMYGTSVDYRHLSLIADYMTHCGGYRPMNRIGAIAECVSPFSRMTFETASRFIAQAACHGETDLLESPSARICVGLPVKIGTGCFELMQNLDV